MNLLPIENTPSLSLTITNPSVAISPQGGKAERGVLVHTSSSKITNNSRKVHFISVDSINHNQKKSNVESYNYYENVVLPKLDRKILNKLYSESYELNNIPDFNLSEYPIELYERFSKYVEKSKNDSLLFFAESSFLKWYQNITKKSRYIFLRSADKKKIKKIRCRYDKTYAELIQNRMNWLMFKYGNENACSITLTLNPSNFRNDKRCMWECFNILLKEFFDNLRLYFKKRDKEFPKYIRCIEAMKGIKETDFVGRGNPHGHICLFGVKYIPKAVIDRFWPYGFTFINSTAKGQKVRYPIHYVTKYITKTYTENDPDNTLNQSLVWFFNKNSFDHSAKLTYPLYKKGDGSWNCEYVVELEPLENDFVEMDLIFECEENLYKIPPPILLE